MWIQFGALLIKVHDLGATSSPGSSLHPKIAAREDPGT